jgi:glucosamine--fructose-6-phosphate aminotransferase (isomerizing)
MMNVLTRLEYRGYDRCGVAVQGSAIRVHKDTGRVKELRKTLPRLYGNLGIGHTRWVTQGQPSQINAHPHLELLQLDTTNVQESAALRIRLEYSREFWRIVK